MTPQPPPVAVHTIGIIGAGKLGRTLAALSHAAGFDVVVAGSGPLARTQHVLDTFAPGTTAADFQTVTSADIVVLAVPLSDALELDPKDFVGAIVVDPTNFWAEADGDRPDFAAAVTSVLVQTHVPQARVVKAFSHVAYKDIAGAARAADHPHRIAVAVASDDQAASERVAAWVSALGFTPVNVGTLEATAPLQPGGALFGVVADEQRFLALWNAQAVTTS